MDKFNIPFEIEHYEKKIYDLKQLIEISKGLNSTLNFNLLIESVLLTMMGQMHIYKAGIFLNKDLEDPNFYLNENYKGFEIRDNSDANFTLHEKDEIIQHFYENGKALTINDIKKEKKFNSSYKFFSKIGVEIVVPLRVKGRVVGLIILGEKLSEEKFNLEEIDFLQTLASIAAIAVENARLYELATVDMMTRLRIHHYFQTRLHEERERSKRSGQPLALLMTDVDHFKKFNDSYGHQTGDIVLKEVARILSSTVRGHDVAARYGGEEFAAILPNTEINEAMVVAERIREKVETNEVETEQGILKVTISIGLAMFDSESDRSNRELIEKTDQALYLAKKKGRNCIEIYGQDHVPIHNKPA